MTPQDLDGIAAPDAQSGGPEVISPADDPSEQAVAVRPSGSRRPLFLVYEETGSVAYAQVLHPHLDPEIPVYALPAPSDSEPPLRTVEGMAARLVRMIQAVQPAGPYRLAGWSFGGLLAYEAAAQLVGRDQAVEFVGMMDTHYLAGERAGAGDPRDEHALLLGMLRLEHGMEEAAGPALAGLASDAATMELEALVARCHETGLLPDHVGVEPVRRMRDRLGASRRATREYFPQPLPMPVHLFPAREAPGADPGRGWRAVLPEASMRVVPVLGSHLSMMEADNVRALGEALSREIGRAAGARGAPPEDGYWPLVTLRFGKGGGAPLFCVPGAGAGATSFAELSGYLDPARPVHALQPRGVDGEMVPHSTVAAAAELYLRAVHGAQPTGPVHLLGHSFGGWVVFEMALRLREAGRPVGSLTILDTEVPGEDDAPVPESDGREAFLKLVDVFEQVAERPLGIGSEEAASLDEAGRLALLHERLVRLGLMPRRSDPELLRGPFRTFATCLRTPYTPAGIYPDAVRLVLLADPARDEATNHRQFEEGVRGWRRWAPGLVFSTGAGNHMTALKSPHVRSLASYLDAAS